MMSIYNNMSKLTEILEHEVFVKYKKNGILDTI